MAQQTAWPVWNPVSTFNKDLTITITALCHTTTFYFTRVEMRHEIGAGSPTSHTFIEPPDKISLEAVPADATGLVYCRARTYHFDASIDLSSTDHASPNQAIASFDAANRIFTITSLSAADYGTYEARIRITLDEYPGADFSAQTHIIEFKITPSCSTTTFTPSTITNM